MKKADQVVVVPYDPGWARLFAKEAGLLGAVLGPEVIQIQHIGSTAVPGASARPIIDILVEVRDLDRFDALARDLEDLGYRGVGEHGIPGRRFLIKTKRKKRSHNVYVFPSGHALIQSCLGLRDFLIAHPQEAQFYSHLKEGLAGQYPNDLRGYIHGKDDFIADVLRRALEPGRAPE